jgi:hypothetical protein
MENVWEIELGSPVLMFQLVQDRPDKVSTEV